MDLGPIGSAADSIRRGTDSWDEHSEHYILLGKQTGGLWRRHIAAVHSGRGQRGGRASFHDDIFS